MHKCMYWLSVKFQSILWVCGINWHNTFADECTQDFRCCYPSIEETPFLKRVYSVFLSGHIKAYKYRKLCKNEAKDK